MQHGQEPPTASLGHVCSSLHSDSWNLDPAQGSLPILASNPCYSLSWGIGWGGPGSAAALHSFSLSDWARQWLSFPGLAMLNLSGVLATWSRDPVHSCIKVAILWSHPFPGIGARSPREGGGPLTLSTGILIFIWHWVLQIL